MAKIIEKKIPDISHHRPVKDWSKVKTSCSFLLSKATQGTTYVDSTLDSFIKNCEKNKIYYWLYAFMVKGNGKAQAKYMVDICKGKVGKYFVGYIIDAEKNPSIGTKPTDNQVNDALDYLDSLGIKWGLYTGYADYSYYKGSVNKTKNSKNGFWWEARYGKNNGVYNSKYPCNKGVALHQFTSLGSCDGISGKIDLNRVVDGVKGLSWFITPITAKNTTTNTPVSTSTISRANFMKACKAIADTIVSDKNWIYSASEKLSDTFSKARKGNRYTSCANFVCFCLQKYGALKETMRFYSDNNGNIVYQASSKYSKSDIETQLKKYHKIITVNKKVSDLKDFLQQGDICCWNGHTNIFDKYDSKGNAMFYDAGRAGTSDGKPMSGNFVSLYRKINRTDKIRKIIRLKDAYIKESIDNDITNKTSLSNTTTIAYYKKYTGKSERIDEVFKAIGVPDKYRDSKTKRKPLAVKNGISNYKGTADQNLKLIRLAKNGKLKKV